MFVLCGLAATGDELFMLCVHYLLDGFERLQDTRFLFDAVCVLEIGASCRAVLCCVVCVVS